MTPRRLSLAVAVAALALVAGAAVLLGSNFGRVVIIPPCGEGDCEPRPVEAFDLFTGMQGLGAAQDGNFEAANVEEVLERGLAFADAFPVHLALRGLRKRVPPLASLGASERC